MRYVVVLVAVFLITVGSCYCDDVTAEEAVGLVAEIDDDVLNALKELDQANDMNFSTTQKLWLCCVALCLEARERAIALKNTTATHMSEHKKEYLIGASAFAAGALAVILFQKLYAKAPTA